MHIGLWKKKKKDENLWIFFYCSQLTWENLLCSELWTNVNIFPTVWGFEKSTLKNNLFPSVKKKSLYYRVSLINIENCWSKCKRRNIQNIFSNMGMQFLGFFWGVYLTSLIVSRTQAERFKSLFRINQ